VKRVAAERNTPFFEPLTTAAVGKRSKNGGSPYGEGMSSNDVGEVDGVSLAALSQR
jgi:hypothetical protein